MRTRIGSPPQGVTWLVWAWHTWEGKRKKPDLRRERFVNGFAGDRFACLEIEIPDEDVVLSDFYSWSVVLLGGLLSETREEERRLEEEINQLSEEEKTEYRERNWQRVFDLTWLDNGWISRGDSIQAAFWELRKEQIREVRFFAGATKRPTREA